MGIHWRRSLEELERDISWGHADTTMIYGRILPPPDGPTSEDADITRHHMTSPVETAVRACFRQIPLWRCLSVYQVRDARQGQELLVIYVLTVI